MRKADVLNAFETLYLYFCARRDAAGAFDQYIKGPDAFGISILKAPRVLLESGAYVARRETILSEDIYYFRLYGQGIKRFLYVRSRGVGMAVARLESRIAILESEIGGLLREKFDRAAPLESRRDEYLRRTRDDARHMARLCEIRLEELSARTSRAAAPLYREIVFLLGEEIHIMEAAHAKEVAARAWRIRRIDYYYQTVCAMRGKEPIAGLAADSFAALCGDGGMGNYAEKEQELCGRRETALREMARREDAEPGKGRGDKDDMVGSAEAQAQSEGLAGIRD